MSGRKAVMTLRFNPPPGWPTDFSAPEPPPGWPLWVDDRPAVPAKVLDSWLTMAGGTAVVLSSSRRQEPCCPVRPGGRGSYRGRPDRSPAPAAIRQYAQPHVLPEYRHRAGGR